MPASKNSDIDLYSIRDYAHHKTTSDDMYIYYSDCYGLFEGMPLHIMGFSQSYDNTMTADCKVFVQNRWRSKNIPVEDLMKNTLKPPKLGCVNVQDFTVRLTRLYNLPSPAKYRRGFRLDSLDVFIPVDRELKLLGRHPNDSGTASARKYRSDLIQAAYNRDYPYYHEAMDDLLSLKKLSVALSDSVMISLNDSINSYILWVEGVPIGRYLKNSGVFKIFTDKYKDPLNLLGVKFKVA